MRRSAIWYELASLRAATVLVEPVRLLPRSFVITARMWMAVQLIKLAGVVAGIGVQFKEVPHEPDF